MDERQIKLQTITGEFLASGLTNEEILLQLQEEQQLTVEEAQATLRMVYDSWISVREALNLQIGDERNWHQHLRMKLLQKVMQSDVVPAQRLALMILDSLAGIQGISTIAVQEVPLQITLVEKEMGTETKSESESEVEKKETRND